MSLLADGVVGDVTDEQTRMLHIVEERADDLNTMVDDMLDSSKLEAGLLGAWRRPCDVTEILSHVTAALDRKATVKGVKLEYDVDSGMPELYCDAEKVGRVLTNLAVNAIKFCGDPGVVRISVESQFDSPDVTFSVSDNGPGIDEGAVQQIFNRFQQLDTTSRGSCKGFGLGLAIAKELVDLNFGQMTVESVVDAGSTFRFTVPKNDSLELMTRYLHHVEHQAECPSIMSLAVARVDSDSNADNGIDAFLNYLLRRDDLLLPIAAGEWLLALPTDKQEVHSYFDQSQRAWEDTNRNRPFGPLPRVEYEWLGSWHIPQEQGLIVQEVSQQLTTMQTNREEIAYV